MTHSQLFKGFKCESQTEHNRRVRSWGTLSGLQHYKRVKRCVGASRLDQEEVTSFNHSHGPAQNQHKVFSAQLKHFWCQDKPRATRTHKIHHGSDLGEATTFSLIVYFAPLHRGHIQMVFFSQDFRNSHSWDSHYYENT